MFYHALPSTTLPTVASVVCDRDGATRSGLLCAVNYMVERLKAEQDVDVFQSVKHTRINRSQLIPQYVSIMSHGLSTVLVVVVLVVVVVVVWWNTGKYLVR